MAGGMILQSVQAAPAAGPAATVSIDGVEVTQVVQNLKHDVVLIAGKSTVARVYLSTLGVTPLTVRGTLGVRRAGSAGWTMVAASADVVLNPASTGPAGLRSKRENLNLSLNFLLPATLLTPGDVEVELVRLESVGPVAPIAIPAGSHRQVTFHPAIPLRVQVIGIRYQVPGAGGTTQTYEPAAIDFALLKSWLQRVYPVATVDWGQIVIDWPGTPAWPTTPALLGIWGRDQVNPFLSNLRGQDVAAGTDHRTHYYGLAADGGGFMRGWASAVPSTPDPSVVACGPAGLPAGTFNWDTDGSYADWYSGHELAHTFGRAHPGFCNGNSHDDPLFPYPNGQISDNAGSFVGYDSGDSTNGLLANALPGVVWHDVMTYCTHQWLSEYTYEGIYQRLVLEDALPGPAPTPGAAPGPSPAGHPGGHSPGGSPMLFRPSGIHVVARIDQTTNVGHFAVVSPVASLANVDESVPLPGEYAIRVVRDGGSPAVYAVEFRQDACGDADDEHVTGSVDVVIPNDSSAHALELLRDGKILHRYEAANEPPEPNDVRPAKDMTAVAGGPGPATFASSRPSIVWNANATGGPTLATAAAGPAPRYTVQVSRDEGRSWRTVGVGLVNTEISFDPSLLAGTDTILVRVNSTNGFTVNTTTQALSVHDL